MGRFRDGRGMGSVPPGGVPLTGVREPAARRMTLVVPETGGLAEAPAAVQIPPGVVDGVPDGAVAIGDSGLVSCFGALFTMLEAIRADQAALAARLKAVGVFRPPERAS
jgi:hypothetical protein